MGREERTSHKQNNFKYALIASVLFAIAVLLQIYSIFQIAGGGEHVPIFLIFLKRQIPAILGYALVIIALIRGKKDIYSIGAVIVLIIASVFVSFWGMIIFVIPARVGLLAIVASACTNCSSESKSLAKQCFFVPAVIMAVVAFLDWLFFWGGSPLSILIEATGMLFMAMWAVDGIEVQKTATPHAKNGSVAYGATTEDRAYCGLVKHILLLIFTFGIWYFIWIYRMTGYLNQVKDEPERNPTTKLLLCLFVPFYSIYWVYKSAQRIDKLAALKGVRSDLSTICLILAIFIGIIPPILMQDKINEIITAGNGATHSEQHTAQAVSPQVNFGAAEELKTYKELLDSGVITQEEFDAKKKQLLNL